MEGNFSSKVRDVIKFSREEALRLGHDYIGTEHLILGIVRLGDGVAVRILKNLDCDLFKLKKTIEKALSELDYTKLSVSVDVYDIDQTFVVVHGLSEKSRSLGFQELLKGNKNYKIDRQAFVMSAENYRIVQIKKTLRSYLDNY